MEHEISNIEDVSMPVNHSAPICCSRGGPPVAVTVALEDEDGPNKAYYPNGQPYTVVFFDFSTMLRCRAGKDETKLFKPLRLLPGTKGLWRCYLGANPFW
jgi:hypothetical protein